MAGVEGAAEGQVGEMGAPNGKSLNVVPKRWTLVGHGDSKTGEMLMTYFQPFFVENGESSGSNVCLCVITLKITFYYGKLEKYTREIEQH